MIPCRNSPASRVAFAAVLSAVLAGCASAVKDPGADRARAALLELQADNELATRAPVAIRDAENAVRAAEQPQDDPAVAKQLAYVAERRVAIAKALAERRHAEDQLGSLTAEREKVLLGARTAEAEMARQRARTAQDRAQSALDEARSQQAAAEEARAETEMLRKQIEELNARPTDRGLVMTLGDVLFATGKAELQTGARNSLDRLVGFLERYPERTAVIEGHTDSAGSESYNLELSQRRADSVRTYLVTRGISPIRIVAQGKGEGYPIASNETAAGRQQNRRVEIIISD